jgi:hypothetical protein
LSIAVRRTVMRFHVRGVAAITLCSMLTVSICALAAPVVLLHAGDAGAPNFLFEIDRAKTQNKIILITEQAGVAGSVLEVFIDRSQKPHLHHLFSGDECKFIEQQSHCEASFAASSPEFAALVNGFVKGRNARVTVADAGVMKMDHAVSLKGVARILGR